VELLLILLLVYFPPLARAFNHVPLPLAGWAWLSFYPPVLYSLDWLRKSFLRWQQHRDLILRSKEAS
jgi:hypothetical protein